MDFRVLRDLQEIREVREVRNMQFINQNQPRENLSEKEFKKRYRFDKRGVEYIVELIRDELSPLSERKKCISAELQVLTALRFFAKGLYQEDNGDLHSLHHTTVSRIVRRVSVALAGKLGDFVKFPNNLNQTKQDFHVVAGFPNVVECIDCTHIKIRNPDKNRPLLYMTRKGFTSLNVQVVCDARYRILDINARWRGSVHDARIWEESELLAKFLRGEINRILLGDGGYPCRSYLLTPLLNPQTAAEQKYNAAHISTRCRIEQCFGYWKSVFRILQSVMLISLDTAKAAICAMAVLHNIRKNMNGDAVDSEDSESEEPEEVNAIVPVPAIVHPVDVRGNIFHAEFIRRHFS